MELLSKDGRRVVIVGTYSYWHCFRSTIEVNLYDFRNDITDARTFLKNRKCEHEKGYIIAKQFNIIRDKLADYSPDKVVYDMDNKKVLPPWGQYISPVITSLGNYFVTSEGKDLIFEIVSLLTYAYLSKVDIICEG